MTLCKKFIQIWPEHVKRGFMRIKNKAQLAKRIKKKHFYGITDKGWGVGGGGRVGGAKTSWTTQILPLWW